MEARNEKGGGENKEKLSKKAKSVAKITANDTLETRKRAGCPELPS